MARKSGSIQPARKAANPNAVVEFTIDNSSTKQPTYQYRTCTAINGLKMDSPEELNIKVDDIIARVGEDAEANGETLGPRATQSIHIALSRLRGNGYIKFLPHHDDIERIVLTTNFRTILDNLETQLRIKQAAFEASSSIQKHRAICTFLRKTLVGRGFKPRMTLREYELCNRVLEAKHEEYLEHLEGCQRQRSPSAAPTEIVADSNEPVPGADDRDSMYVDDVPRMAAVATPVMTMPQTPLRRSSTLNNHEAYPSPESVPRGVVARPATPPSSPSRSGSHRPTTPGTFDQDPSDSEGDMDIDMDAPRTDHVLFAPVDWAEQVQNLQAEIERLNKKIEDIEAELKAEKAQSHLMVLTQKALSSWWMIRVHTLKREKQDCKDQFEARSEANKAQLELEKKARQEDLDALLAVAARMQRRESCD